MGELIVDLAGTPAGARLALALALISAVMHATLGALQKGRHDPWVSRGVMDLCTGLLAAPFALFVVPWPNAEVWLLLGGVMLIHLGYKVCLAMAYERADFTLVYPLVRGTGVLATVALATVVFGEHYGWRSWAGVALLSGAIIGLAVVNIRSARIAPETLRTALSFALITGAAVAVYTVYDAYGIRRTPDPFTFLAWFFVVEAVLFPLVVRRRIAKAVATGEIGALLRRGFLGALVALISFGGIMLATRLDKVGEAAAVRELSIVFAAILGVLFLGERLNAARLILIALIAAGAMIVEFG